MREVHSKKVLYALSVFFTALALMEVLGLINKPSTFSLILVSISATVFLLFAILALLLARIQDRY